MSLSSGLTVDCANVEPIDPVKMGQMHSIDNVPYLVSFSCWDERTREPTFFVAGEVQVLQANNAVHTVQKRLQNTLILPKLPLSTSEPLLDGFMTTHGIDIGRPVFAIDPISYNLYWKAL
jgi:hypothetical protein